MIYQKKNGLERRVVFRPAWHKINPNPRKNYGVEGMEIQFLVVGKKGAVHFLLSTGMMLKKTWDYWRDEGKLDGEIPRIMNMGIDVGYHAKKKQFESQELRWPIKMMLPKGYSPDSWKGDDGYKNILKTKFVKVGKKPPVCDVIGVPCYCDGSALRAEEWKDIFLEHGDEPIWKMLEEEYHSLK